MTSKHPATSHKNLTYDQTLAVMRALHRVPGEGFGGPLTELLLPVWQGLTQHLEATAPSSEQRRRDERRTMRCRPRKDDAAAFDVAEAEALSEPAAAPPQTLPDPVAAAGAIVKDFDVDTIDWSKEPASEYERRVRALYLSRADDLRLTMLVLGVLDLPGFWQPASDLSAAHDESGRRAAEVRATRERARVREIREAVGRDEQSNDGAQA